MPAPWLFQRRAASRRRTPKPRSSTPRCSNCQGTAFIPALDNLGNRYMGCARCVVAPPQLRRICLDVNPLIVAEIIDCVSERINRIRGEGKPIPAATRIAFNVLHDLLRKP